MANIISYNDIIEIMESIAQRHYQLNSFFLGKDWELANNDDIVYPLLQVYPEFAKMPINDYKQFKTLEIVLNCKVIDLTTPGEENEKDVHSDTLRIAQDIVNELNAHPFYVRSNVSLMEDIEFESIEEFDDDVTAGWSFSLRLKIINANTFCGMPIAELPGVSANGPSSSGTYVYTDWRGPTGPQGPVGPTGADGYQGVDGATGPTGPTLGLDASLAINNNSGTYNIIMGTATKITSANSTNQIGLDEYGAMSFTTDNGGYAETFLALGDNYSTLSSYKSGSTLNIESITDGVLSIHTVTGSSPFFSEWNTIKFDTAGIHLLSNEEFTLTAITSSVSGELRLNNNLRLPTLTANTLTYVDTNNILNTATIGTGLTFSSGVLSTTSTIPVVSTTTVITTATSSIIDVSTPNTYYSVTSLSSAIIFTTSGTYSNFDKILIRIKDNGTARALTFDPAFFEAKGMALPTTTVLGKVITIGFIFDSVTNKYGCVSVAQEI